MPRQIRCVGQVALLHVAHVHQHARRGIHRVALPSPQCGSWCLRWSPCSSPPVPTRAQATGRGGWTTCAGSGPTTATTSGPIGRSRRRRGRLLPPAARRAALGARDPQPRARHLERARLPGVPLADRRLRLDVPDARGLLPHGRPLVGRASEGPDAHAVRRGEGAPGQCEPVGAGRPRRRRRRAGDRELGRRRLRPARRARPPGVRFQAHRPGRRPREAPHPPRRGRARRLADRRPRQGQGDRDADRSARGARPIPRECVPALQHRAMFTNAKPTDPAAAIISRDVPDAKAGIPASPEPLHRQDRAADAGIEVRATTTPGPTWYSTAVRRSS